MYFTELRNDRNSINLFGAGIVKIAAVFLSFEWLNNSLVKFVCESIIF